MAKTADVVVVGGGVLGASTAYFLAHKGVKRVVVLERYLPASGSTGKTAGLVRMHYSNEVVARMALWSRDLFIHWTDRIGGPPVFHKTGWLFLCPPEHVQYFQANIAMLKRIGVDSEVISPEEVKKRVPSLNVEGVAIAEYEAKSGWAEGHGTVSGFLAAARRLGAETVMTSPVTNIRLDKGRVRAVETAREVYETPVVVNAAGPWATQVSKMVGVDLPLELSREEEVIFQLPPDSGRGLCAVSDAASRIYFRPDTPAHLLVGVGHPKANQPADPDHYRETADAEFIEYVSGRIAHRLPLSREALLIRGYAGLYTITPDWNYLLGAVPEVPGYYLATGGSGHGFKIGPAAGLMLAEQIADGKATSFDIDLFRLSRFREGALFKSTYGGNRG